MVDFFENGLCIHCHLARNELIEFLTFNEQTEESWRARDSNLQKELGEILDRYPESNHKDIIDSYAWDLHLNQSKYPDLHRESLLITIFNFLEHQLNHLCKILYDSIESNLKLNEIYGQGVERALLFLTKIAKIDLSSFGSELPEIKGVNLVRNAIVHNGGLLPEDENSKINRFIAGSDCLSGVESGYINIQTDFIASFISILIAFFDKLDVEIQKHIQEYK
ncbi:hypothetical protein SAMN05444507_102226 [Pseudomonas syringae]|uniref:hypothetical protein n=1 Tax=Pseudomonas syringae TaxID=317 RepID=UPI0008E8CB9A|nr:hypothetical protein [Pseudomonas syringae]SFH69231.1 hypothetical protein SAMN05444507_102226 [Pseudomonas syringae]